MTQLRYTMIFLQFHESILLLNRIKAPQMGMWTGVGGKIESGESPLSCALREVNEETGLSVQRLVFSGTATWTTGTVRSGMYLYFGRLEDTLTYPTPVATDEGILDFKSIEWILASDNIGVPPHVKHFLPDVLSQRIRDHQCLFHDGRLIDVQSVPMDTVHDECMVPHTANS